MDTYFVTFAYRLPSPTMRAVQDQYQIPWCLNVNKNELWKKNEFSGPTQCINFHILFIKIRLSSNENILQQLI